MNTEFVNRVLDVKKNYGGKMTYFQMINELKDYTPEDKHMTSWDEFHFLHDYFGLDDMSSYDMQNLRDMVVMMFDSWMDNAKDSDERWSLSTGMMSITAVIDVWMRK